jgi:di/tricarboxylate transporter
MNIGAALVRMMVPVAAVSAFINNTPLVALMIPIIQKWSRKVDLPPSQLMIPLSFATYVPIFAKSQNSDTDIWITCTEFLVAL